MRDLDNQIYSYLKGWYSLDQWTDFNLALDSGYLELAASLLIEAGAINSKGCYPEYENIEAAIEKKVKKYGKRNLNKDRKACFNSAEVWVNPNTNEHAFIRNSDIDYLMNETEMRKIGYITDKEYYTNLTV